MAHNRARVVVDGEIDRLASERTMLAAAVQRFGSLNAAQREALVRFVAEFTGWDQVLSPSTLEDGVIAFGSRLETAAARIAVLEGWKAEAEAARATLAAAFPEEPIP